MTELEVGRLKDQLRYEPQTGNLYWLLAKKGLRVGAKAGAITKTGHISVSVDNKRMYAHRIAWAIHHGIWPTKQIDHINGVPGDNRIKNLREVDHLQNRQNTFGVPHWYKTKKKWQVQLRAFGRRVHVGYFDTLEEATEARRLAAIKLRGQYARSP